MHVSYTLFSESYIYIYICYFIFILCIVCILCIVSSVAISIGDPAMKIHRIYLVLFSAFFKGSPYVAPSEIVQKIMERLREHDSHEMDTSLYNYDQHSSLHQNGKLSVLSPDNRQFLEQSRSKSPDMRNKRMIIGRREI